MVFSFKFLKSLSINSIALVTEPSEKGATSSATDSETSKYFERTFFYVIIV